MNGHVGTTGSTYRPKEQPPAISDGLLRALPFIYALEFLAIVAVVHFWPQIEASWRGL